MAKQSKLAKAKRQLECFHRYEEKRRQLKKEHNWMKLQQLPRDASPTRQRHRDQVDGRPRGYMRKFGMSRIRFRELALKGLIPGVRKSSW